MWKYVSLSGASLLPFLAISHGLLAATPNDDPLMKVQLAHPTCTIAQAAIAKNPDLEKDKIIGRVYSIAGPNMWVELENGETRLAEAAEAPHFSR
jgi:hypothetical protein